MVPHGSPDPLGVTGQYPLIPWSNRDLTVISVTSILCLIHKDRLAQLLQLCRHHLTSLESLEFCYQMLEEERFPDADEAADLLTSTHYGAHVGSWAGCNQAFDGLSERLTNTSGLEETTVRRNGSAMQRVDFHGFWWILSRILLVPSVKSALSFSELSMVVKSLL